MTHAPSPSNIINLAAERDRRRARPANPAASALFEIATGVPIEAIRAGSVDRYRGISNGRRVIFLSAEDIQERGLSAGSFVDLVSRFGRERMSSEMLEIYGLPASASTERNHR